MSNKVILLNIAVKSCILVVVLLLLTVLWKVAVAAVAALVVVVLAILVVANVCMFQYSWLISVGTEWKQKKINVSQ